MRNSMARRHIRKGCEGPSCRDVALFLAKSSCQRASAVRAHRSAPGSAVSIEARDRRKGEGNHVEANLGFDGRRAEARQSDHIVLAGAFSALATTGQAAAIKVLSDSPLAAGADEGRRPLSPRDAQ